MEKKKQISEYKEGDTVDDVFVVKMKKKFFRYAGGFCFHLLLTDSSGKSIDYAYWGDDNEKEVKAVFDSIKKDGIVHVKGRASLYKDRLQISTNLPDTIILLQEGEYNKKDFIRVSKRNLEELRSELNIFISKVQNEQLSRLLKSVFNAETAEKFKNHPGAISIHHNWLGGLLEHTLEVAKYCEISAKLFPDLDKDLLITGALLHDIGKLEELEMTTRIKGTNKGQFAGHLVLGTALVLKKMDELHIDNETKNKVLHLMISHHGKTENGSPKEPMFPEAVALYFADDMSSKIAEMLNFIDENKAETEDDFMYHNKKGLNIFLR